MIEKFIIILILYKNCNLIRFLRLIKDLPTEKSHIELWLKIFLDDPQSFFFESFLNPSYISTNRQKRKESSLQSQQSLITVTNVRKMGNKSITFPKAKSPNVSYKKVPENQKSTTISNVIYLNKTTQIKWHLCVIFHPQKCKLISNNKQQHKRLQHFWFKHLLGNKSLKRNVPKIVFPSIPSPFLSLFFVEERIFGWSIQ